MTYKLPDNLDRNIRDNEFNISSGRLLHWNHFSGIVHMINAKNLTRQPFHIWCEFSGDFHGCDISSRGLPACDAG